MAEFDSRHSLIQSYLDGGATVEQLKELGELLIANPQLADDFVASVRLDALLESHFVERREEADWCGENFAMPSSTIRPRRFAILAGTAVSILVMGWLASWWHPSILRSTTGHRVLSGQIDVNGSKATAIPVDTPFRVSGASAAMIRTADGCDARLSPETTGILHRDGNAAVVELSAGGGEFHLDGACALRVDTLAGSIVAQNASFQVETQSSIHSGVTAMAPNVMTLLTVAVLTGQVEVRGNDEKVKIAAGEKRVFSSEKIPSFTGRVIEISPDGKELALEGSSPKPGAPAPRRKLQISDTTSLQFYGVYEGGDQPTVGYLAEAVLDKEVPLRAIQIAFGNPDPDVSGTVVDIGEQRQSVTVEIYRKNDAPLRRTIQITERTRLLVFDDDLERHHPALGDRLEAWLESDSNSAIELRLRFNKKAMPVRNEPLKGKKQKPMSKPGSGEQNSETKGTKLPASKTKTKKSTSGTPKSENAAPMKPSKVPRKDNTAAAKPTKATGLNSLHEQGLSLTRDSVSISAEIDRIVEQRLSAANVAASPLASDAEFLRRATIDIAGRIPTYEETMAFLENDDPGKRQALIDRLLNRASYGEQFATIWNELITPHTMGKTKTGRDPFKEWLAEQFNQNRGWDEIVGDMLTVEGKIRELPQSGFILANSENQEPRPNLLADATARLFWGVQLRCAECHDHPFASWKQADFWGTAAFFSRVRRGYTEGKNPSGWTLTEQAPDDTEIKIMGAAFVPLEVPGPAILLPDAAGKAAGQIVKARFLGGDDVDWNDDGPFRSRFSNWATGGGNPYFAANAVNRLWAHFFGRGLVNPLDQFHEENPPSHPQLLDRLSAEFVASNFDLKHLVRCICNSRVYQRSSHPTDGNENDDTLLSHMAVRVMRPEVLYDSLSIVLYPPQAKPGPQGPQPIERAGPIPGVSRDEFVRFFGSAVDENTGSTVNLGIPQYLRLMNGAIVDGETPGARRLSQFHDSTEKLVEVAFLMVYSRRPTEEETRLVAAYIDASPDRSSAWEGLLWTLLNSSEFVLNH